MLLGKCLSMLLELLLFQLSLKNCLKLWPHNISEDIAKDVVAKELAKEMEEEDAGSRRLLLLLRLTVLLPGMLSLAFQLYLWPKTARCLLLHVARPTACLPPVNNIVSPIYSHRYSHLPALFMPSITGQDHLYPHSSPFP